MINLRPATKKDAMLLFKWTNDSEVRKNSFSSKPIDLDTHLKWYDSKLKDDKSKIFIISKDEEEVGQIRIEINNDIGVINYSIDADYRGQGIGTEILKLIKNEFKDINLVGYVKKENLASIKAFEKADYRKIEHDGFIEFISKVN